MTHYEQNTAIEKMLEAAIGNALEGLAAVRILLNEAMKVDSSRALGADPCLPKEPGQAGLCPASLAASTAAQASRRCKSPRFAATWTFANLDWRGFPRPLNSNIRSSVRHYDPHLYPDAWRLINAFIISSALSVSGPALSANPWGISGNHAISIAPPATR